MGGKAKAPPPPDYSGIAAASEKAAGYSFQLGKDQLAWAKEQYGKDSAVIKKVVDAALARQTTNDATAAKDRARYEDIYQPLEDKAAAEALDYASPERQEYEAGRAGATVATQFDAARRAATQNLESFGVDPSSTRYAGLDLASRTAQAAATAGAENQSRVQTEAVGRALRSEAINVGRGYPGQIAGTYGTALQSGNSAANSTLAGTASGASTMGTAPQWQGQGVGALNTWGNTLNMGYGNQLDAFTANQQASSGIGGLLGAGMGMIPGLAEGGAVPAAGAIPNGPTSGGNVPRAASPTGGRAIDDVPARLTAGEFVVPKEAVSWLGEKHFQSLIEKSKKERSEAGAKPQMALAPMQPPTFTSRSAALPIG